MRDSTQVGCRHVPTCAHSANSWKLTEPQLLDLLEREDVDKFYFSHLNYAGRGHRNRKHDTVHRQTREAMDLLG